MEVHDPRLNFRIIKNASVKSLPGFFWQIKENMGKYNV